MRSLNSGEAAELLGVDHTYLRKLHREAKITEVETTAGSHRRYTLDDIWEIRQSLEANVKKPGTYVPGHRSGDELQVVSVVNFKAGRDRLPRPHIWRSGWPSRTTVSWQSTLIRELQCQLFMVFSPNSI